jgi:hypothetical protein
MAEVRQVRTDEIKLVKIDLPEVNIRYTGRSSSMRGADSDAIWQIHREYRYGDVTESTYANMGSYNCTWTDRATYFDTPTASALYPLAGEGGCCPIVIQYPQAIGNLTVETGASLRIFSGATYYVRPGYTLNQRTTIKANSIVEVTV